VNGRVFVIEVRDRIKSAASSIAAANEIVGTQTRGDYYRLTPNQVDPNSSGEDQIRFVMGASVPVVLNSRHRGRILKLLRPALYQQWQGRLSYVWGRQ
jgi:hypothetical protein